MWNKIKSFFIRIMPTKRKIIQVYAALLHNANMMGFVTGEIFKGDSKIVCAPGLNCYSCPGAVGACPLGTIQNALYESKTKTPTYVLGIILLYCIIFGRTVCGWLCPIGLVQELLYKIKTPKLQKNRVTRALSYFKYILLAVLVVAIPLIFSRVDVPVPGFCKYVCPAGTLGGAVSLLINPNNSGFFDYLGPIFTWKFAILIAFVIGSIFIYRVFCRFLCPLGAIYGIFNKLSILGVKVDKSKCDNCGACVKFCKMDVKEVGDHECIMCGECKDVCHANAIHWKTIGKLVEKDLADAGFVAQTDLGAMALPKRNVEAEEIEMSANEAAIDNNFLAEPTSSEDDKLDDEILNNPAIKKKRFRITELHQKIFKITSYVLMAALLIFTFVYANFMTKGVISINDYAKDVIVELYNGEQFFSRTDDNSVIYYFYDKADKNTIKEIKRLDRLTTSSVLAEYEVAGRVKLVLVSSYQNKDANKEALAKTKLSANTYLGFDNNKSSVLKSFTEKAEYPYYVFSDIKDKVSIHTSKGITDEDFNGTIVPGAMGVNVGNQVGDICFSTDLAYVGKEGFFNLNEHKDKVTVLNFWYTSCTPCVLELPYFNEIASEFKDDINVVAVHDGDLYNEAEVLSFIDKSFKDTNMIFVSDKEGSPYHKSLNGGNAYPMTIIVNKEGKITFRINGELDKPTLRAEVIKAINS